MEAKLLRFTFSATPTIIALPHSPTPTSAFNLTKRLTFSKPTSHFPKRFKLSLQPHATSTGSVPTKRRIDGSENLTLDHIRHSLIRLEDSIIFSLLERSQYCYNEDTYDPDAFSMDGFHGSLVEYILRETETLHAKVGRYKSPDEHPFFPAGLPEPLLPPLQYPKVLHPIADSININDKVWNVYFRVLIPQLVKEGDDGNCGSTAVCDTMCLQALSKRIHYGKFVAEAKFQAAPDAYKPAIMAQGNSILSMANALNCKLVTQRSSQLILIILEPKLFSVTYKSIQLMVNGTDSDVHAYKFEEIVMQRDTFMFHLQDKEKLMDMLTYVEVEEAIKRRVKMKTKTYGQEVAINMKEHRSEAVYKINPSLVADLYSDWIMPLTKEVQVAYLLRKLD
ncbi:hypothetical protein Lal_00028052 [Lupinus albus]|nr:hypothetical protein Lal_00028052 [Lupinus albus]